MLYNVVLVSPVQPSESLYIHICMHAKSSSSSRRESKSLITFQRHFHKYFTYIGSMHWDMDSFGRVCFSANYREGLLYDLVES